MQNKSSKHTNIINQLNNKTIYIEVLMCHRKLHQLALLFLQRWFIRYKRPLIVFTWSSGHTSSISPFKNKNTTTYILVINESLSLIPLQIISCKMMYVYGSVRSTLCMIQKCIHQNVKKGAKP